MRAVDVDEVEKLLSNGAQLVEVLPADEYREEHLPGAVNVPLKELDRERVATLNRDAPVIVYCHDYQRDMGPRAAWRLESLGFREVYDYAAGKADWFARGHPVEGERAEVPRVGRSARSDVPICRLEEPVSVVAERVRAAGWDTCIVVNDGGIVLGRLFKSELSGDVSTAVEDAMRSGPSTFRPNVTVEEMTGSRGAPCHDSSR